MKKEKRFSIGKENYLILIVVIVVVLLGSILIFFAMKRMMKYEVVSYTLTEDIYHGPIVYNEELYFHTSYEIERKNLSDNLGLIEYDSQDYSLFLMRVFYPAFIRKDITDPRNTYLKTLGIYKYSFMKANESEKQEYTNNLLKENGDYHVLFYTSDFGEFDIQIDYELVSELENIYGEITYNMDDFGDSLNTFYIYLSNEEKIDYIGVIFKEGENIYYGNKTNIIEKDVLNKTTGESLYDKLYEIIKR